MTRGARESEDRFRRYVARATATILAIAALMLPADALAADLFHGYLCCNSTAYSGWNYWYAEEAYKQATGLSYLGMSNSSAANYVPFSGTYKYVDRTQLGIGGYMRGWVEGKTSYSIWYDAYICVC